MVSKILTIHEVRRRIESIYNTLETLNCHAVQGTLCSGDYDEMRKAWENCREVMSSRWTNQLL